MSVLSTIVGLVGGPVFDKAVDLFQDFQQGKLTKEQLKYEIATLEERNAHEISLAQIETNRTEATSGSLFVSGWRPAVGWICALGFATNFLIVPMGNFALALANHPVVLPMVDLSTMLPVLLGMLGLGGLRTVEKTRGVSREQ